MMTSKSAVSPRRTRATTSSSESPLTAPVRSLLAHPSRPYSIESAARERFREPNAPSEASVRQEVTIMTIEKSVDSARLALKYGLGLAAFLAGLDKFFNLRRTGGLREPVARASCRSPHHLHVRGGIIEMAVGLAILTRWTALASYVAMGWLVLIRANLVTTGMYFDVAVRRPGDGESPPTRWRA